MFPFFHQLFFLKMADEKNKGEFMKKENTAGLLSFLFMGLGQFYNHDWVSGIVLMLLEFMFIFAAVSGVIYNAFWGVITLGQTPGIQGDHSIFLLINGLVVIILFFLFFIIYYLNIKSAIASRKKIEELRLHTGTNFSAESILSHNYNKYFPHILMSPSFFLILFFTFLPILFTLLIAFTNFSAPYHLPPGNLVDWTGFDNFKKLFTLDGWKETFWGVLAWTLVWTITTTVLNYFGGLGLAVLINAKDIKFKKFWRTLLIVPYAIPAFISLLTFRLLLSGPGPLNSFLVNTGLTAEKIPFLSDHTLAKITVIVVYLWAGAPYWMALMSGVLTNISDSYYEAARIDGASNWQQLINITVPMVLFQTAPLLIMTFAHNFNNFTMIYLLADGNPQNPTYKQAGSTDILISWIYKMTLEKQWYGMAACVAIIIFICIAVIAIFSFKRTKSFKDEDMI